MVKFSAAADITRDTRVARAVERTKVNRDFGRRKTGRKVAEERRDASQSREHRFRLGWSAGSGHFNKTPTGLSLPGFLSPVSLVIRGRREGAERCAAKPLLPAEWKVSAPPPRSARTASVANLSGNEFEMGREYRVTLRTRKTVGEAGFYWPKFRLKIAGSGERSISR